MPETREVLVIDFTSGERLRFDVNAAPEVCSTCLRDPGDEHRLDFDIIAYGRLLRLRICRTCLSEHTPVLLAEIEAGG